jgi:hypothetical protein
LPVAFICRLIPTRVSGKMGVTVIEDRIAEFTVRVALPDTPPEAAVIVTVPRARPAARPVLLTVDIPGLDEDQVASLVISKLDPSE